jgi:hypothetical protein
VDTSGALKLNTYRRAPVVVALVWGFVSVRDLNSSCTVVIREELLMT